MVAVNATVEPRSSLGRPNDGQWLNVLFESEPIRDIRKRRQDLAFL